MDARPGVSSMSLALLIVGIFAVLAGLLTILFGFTVREFSLGSTLIISGTIGVCSGMLLAGLYVVVVELKGIARRLAGSAAPGEVRVRPVLPGLAAPGAPVSEPCPRHPAMKIEPPPAGVRRRGRARPPRASVRASSRRRSRKPARRLRLRKRRAAATCCSHRAPARSASARRRRRRAAAS